MRLHNVVLPGKPSQKWDVDVEGGTIRSVSPAADAASSPPSLVLPSLCHPHIHLDKPYLLTCGCRPEPHDDYPDYSDLAPKTGSLAEALRTTKQAKTRYTAADLYQRGAQLLAAGYAHGVTAVRAFVEVDSSGEGPTALAAAVRLKQLFAGRVAVQLCAFAQEPLFSSAGLDVIEGLANRAALLHALDSSPAGAIDVLGTTPYVERSRRRARRNIAWAVETARARGLHLDFHIDYALTPAPAHAVVEDDDDDYEGPMVLDVIHALQRQGPWRADRSVVLGHATHLTRLSGPELAALATVVRGSELPVWFVGLPTSDLYMMGRDGEEAGGEEGGERLPHARPRGTMQVVSMVKELGLRACLGVNNVGNAFTPFGTGDPLHLACWGVGLYHAGGEGDAELLVSGSIPPSFSL